MFGKQNKQESKKLCLTFDENDYKVHLEGNINDEDVVFLINLLDTGQLTKIVVDHVKTTRPRQCSRIIELFQAQQMMNQNFDNLDEDESDEESPLVDVVANEEN